ncbi:MAG TPA: holo-ACP synthase [Spirochaetota bacterium]|nr:holo-ACP synthase [Spirochaetota bacterium]
MITGTGIDIVNINRIKKSLEEYSGRFIAKILSDEEIKIIPSAGRDEFIAGRFAAKEALVKAAGISLPFRNITILNDKNGKPYIKEIPDGIGNKKIHISISHDTDYAAASVIIEE